MAAPIASVTIVGGGTAGWLAAGFLSIVFEEAVASGKMTITLIESPNIPTIGVGEASAPGMPHTLMQLGADEAEFFRRTNASFKLGGKFINWNVDTEGTPRSWINPFDGAGRIKGRPIGYYFSAFGQLCDGDTHADDLTEVLSPAPDLIAARKGPRLLGQPHNFAGPLRYAYHMDALQLAAYLKELSVERGVRHVLDDVVEVELDERGFVAALELKERGREAVEFVLDATGFRGRIIKGALGEPFASHKDFLLNDRACALQLPHEDETVLEPATRATGLSAGWSFHVPLFNRIGTGYVYSSAFLSDEQAIDEFVTLLGPRAAGKTPRVISWECGKIARSWVKNCIAIGLSSSFVEPLEATAIVGTELALRWLYTYWPDRDFSPVLQARYNKELDRLFAEYVDFIQLHFALTNRTDTPYWRAMREEVPMTDSLKANLELWRYTLPNPFDLETQHFFSASNYMVALFGKGFYEPGHHFPSQTGIERYDWERFIRKQRAARAPFIEHAPDHRTLLLAIREGRAEEPRRPAPAQKAKRPTSAKAAPRPSVAPPLAGTVPLPGTPLRPVIKRPKGR